MSPAYTLAVVVLLFAVHGSKSELHLRFTDPILFDLRSEKKLNTTKETRTQQTKAKDMMGCLSECVPVHWCKSVNLKTTPEKDGLHVCELLSSDRFTKSNNLTENVAYQHLTIKTPCDLVNRKPCHNGAECIWKDNKLQCKCHGGFSGEQCEIDGSWSTWGPWVCPCPQTRKRTCLNPVTLNGAKDCLGLKQETRQCQTITIETIGCDAPLGMIDKSIPGQSITASSHYSPPGCAPYDGRLNGMAGWCAASGFESRVGIEHLQIDLGDIKNVTKIATQGRHNTGQFVTKYSLSYSNDTASWIQYSANCSKKIFNGNADSDTVVTNDLSVPIKARHIRVIPEDYNVWMSMRCELYGC